MTTSKEKRWELCSLLFKTTQNYESNLQTLLSLIEKAKPNSLIVAHEVCLTGFDYENLEDATSFASNAIEKLKIASKNKIIIFTLLEEKEGKVYNNAKVFYGGEVLYSRAKARLFQLGNEDKYMKSGNDESVAIVEVAGIKIAVLICFELRFRELLERCEGADVIAVPAWWGVLRSEHFKTLAKSLAIMNQCYVLTGDALNSECSGLSAIINPNGEAEYNNKEAFLSKKYSQKEIRFIRRYIKVKNGKNKEKYKT